jgi:hypothetical protein
LDGHKFIGEVQNAEISILRGKKKGEEGEGRESVLHAKKNIQNFME